MTPSGKYTPYIGRLVAVMLFLTSAGFTTVLHYCTMQKALSCSLTGSGEQGSCQCMASDPVSGPAVQQPAGCRMTAVAGGFIAIQAPLEQNLSSEHSSLIATLGAAADLVLPSMNHTSLILTRTPGTVFSPAVEKYVLNETFLI